MSQSAPDPAVALLERLLLLSEKSPDRVRPASVAPDYDTLLTAESISKFEARLLAAERAGAIEIQRGRRERRHLIDRIRVKDPVALARHLGRAPAKEVAVALQQTLLPIVMGGESWLVALLDAMVSRWSKGDSAYRLSVLDAEPAQEFFSLLTAISKDLAKGMDGRTFSLKINGDSKSLDRHASRIANVLAQRFGEPGMDHELVWSRIGLERYRHPVHVRGGLIASDAQGILVDGRARPFASFHPDTLALMRVGEQPAALLTIENYASFNRYAREISDGSLVVYTGGFASAGVVEVLKRVLGLLDDSVPFFHWGDIDPGGLRIFRYLEEVLPRAPRPHLMDRSLAESLGQPAERDGSLVAIASSDSSLARLADWLASGTNIRHLEQEAIDPVTPCAADALSGAISPAA